jgi:hypothetical protein
VTLKIRNDFGSADRSFNLKKKRNEKSRAVSRKQNIFPRVRDGSESSEGLNE